jgi:hypothetical protein
MDNQHNQSINKLTREEHIIEQKNQSQRNLQLREREREREREGKPAEKNFWVG